MPSLYALMPIWRYYSRSNMRVIDDEFEPLEPLHEEFIFLGDLSAEKYYAAQRGFVKGYECHENLRSYKL